MSLLDAAPRPVERPAQPPFPPAGRGPAPWISWAIVATFLAGEIAVILTARTGPFLDESIYAVAGRRTLEGHGLADYYLTWFAGSLLWPALVGVADAAAGLTGARLLAAALVTLAVLAIVRAAGNLFGPRTQIATAVLATTNGATFALGHLAVYDTLALAAVAGAGVFATELVRTDDRRHLVAMALCLVLATLAKYPALLFGGAPLFALLATTRRRRAPLDCGLAAAIITAALLAYFLVAREQLAAFLSFRTEQNPGFGVSQPMIAFQLAYLGLVPIVLALAGWCAARGRRRELWPLLAGPLVPAAYQLGTHTAVGIDKHVVFASLFALPLAGHCLVEAWDRRRSTRPVIVAALAALAGFGALQVVRIDRSWLDARPPAHYLAEHVRPGDRLLVDNSWPYVEELYPNAISSPFQVYDVYRVQHGQATTDLCHFDWFVESPGGSSWPAAIRSRIAACGTYRLVYADREVPRVGFGHDLSYFTYSSDVRVYRRVATA